jgi:tetratricopeptide (TPR) repeat protein
MLSRTVTILIMLMMALPASADRKLDRLIKKHKYQKAFTYIEKKFPPEKRDIDVWLKAGTISEGLGKSEKALGCYLAVVRKDINNEEALRSLVRLYSRMKYYPNAYTMVKKLLQIKGEDHNVLWEASKICINLKKFDEAEEHLLKIYKFKTEAQKELGDIYYQKHQYDKAVHLYKSYFTRSKNLEIAKKIVAYYKKKENISEAIKYFEYVADNDKKDFIAKLYLARYWIKASESSKAMNYYAKVSEKNYEILDYFNIGDYKKAEGKFNDAIKYLSVVIDRGDKNSELFDKSNVNIGLIYIEQKNYKQAITYLSSVKDKVPDYNLHMARAYDALKNNRKAEKYASLYLKKHPSNIMAKMIYATALEKRGYRTKARKIREKVLVKSPNNSNIHYEMGIYYYENGQYSNAIKHFEKSYLTDQNITCMEKIAYCAYKINKIEKSRDASELVLEIKPNNKTALDILYNIYMSREKYNNSVPYLEKLTKLYPMNLKYWIKLSKCYEKLNIYNKIIIVDEKIVELSPENVKSKRRLAENRFKKGKYSDALNMYSDLIRMDKIKDTDYPNIVTSSLKLKLKDKAVEYLNQYSSLKPNDANIWKELGELNFDLGNYTSSLTEYCKALNINPDIKGVYKNYSKLVVIKKWKVSSIIAISEKAIKLKEYDFDIYSNLGDAYIRIGNYKKAFINYQEAMKINPRHIIVFNKLAQCQIKINKIDDAIISYEQIIVLDTNTYNLKILGDLYNSKNNKSEAVKNYKKFLKSNEDDRLATYVAMYEHEKGNHTEALKYFDKMTAFSRKTMYARGKSYLYTKKYKECIDVLTDFTTKYSGTKKYYYANKMLGIANDCMNNGKAIYYYQVYLRRNNDKDIAFRVGELFEKTDKKQALKVFYQNSTKYPKDYRNYTSIGKLERNEKKAAYNLEKAVQLNDTILWVWLKLGNLYHNLGKEEKKIEAYKRAVAIAPHNFEANKYLGMNLYKKGKNKEALLYLELARSIKSKDALVMYTLGKCYIKEGRNSEATMLLQIAKKIQPDSCNIRFGLINHLMNQKMYKEALVESVELIKIKDNSKYFDQHMAILFRLYKYKTIVKVIEIRRRKDPENISLLMKMANAQYLDNNLDESLQSYVMVSFIKEGYEPAMIGRARVYLKMNKIDNARTYYEKVLKSNPKSMDALLGLVNLFKSTGEHDLFVEYLRRAREADPNNKTVKKWMQTL